MSTVAEQTVDETKADPLTLSGDSFGAKLADSKAKAAEKVEAPVIENPVIKPDAKITVEKPAEAAKPSKGKTPLDLPAKAAESTPTDDDAAIAEALKAELSANASPSAKANLGMLRKGYEREHAKVKELAAQLEELKAKAPTSNPEIEQRLKVAEDLVKERDAVLERVAFERSPRFQQFVKAGESELAAAKAYVEGTEIDPSVIELASRAIGSKRIAILTDANLEQNAIAAVMPHLARIDAINRDQKAAQENWKGTQAQWQAEQKAEELKQNAAVKEHEDRVFNTVTKRMSEEVVAYRHAEDNADWNAGVASRIALVKDVFEGKLPLEKTSEILHKGVAFDIVEEARVDTVNKLNDALAELERIKAVTPGAGSSFPDKGGSKAPTGDPMKDAASTFEEMRARRSGGV